MKIYENESECEKAVGKQRTLEREEREEGGKD